MKRFLILLFTFFAFVFHIAYGEVMTGSVYKMDFDSINFAGERSSSTVYSLEDTLGEIATGNSSSTVYKLEAGYEMAGEDSVSLSVSPNDITMSPALGGLSGGTSNGMAEVNVSTNSPAGYGLYVATEETPTLTSQYDSFADYSPTGAAPDYDFNVAASESKFGFTAEGPDIVARYHNSGTTCGTGSSDATYQCWDGLSTTLRQVAASGAANDPTGATTTVRFRAGVGESRVQKAGTYHATTTVTAIAL